MTGSTDASLATALGITEQQLAKMKGAVDTLNKGFNQEAFVGTSASAQRGFEEATAHASKFRRHDGSGRLWSCVVDMVQGFFDAAVQNAQSLKQALVDASNVAANFETQSFELGKEVGFGPEQVKEFTTYLYQRSQKVPFTVPVALEAARNIAVSSTTTDLAEKEQGTSPDVGEYGFGGGSFC